MAASYAVATVRSLYAHSLYILVGFVTLEYGELTRYSSITNQAH